MEPAVIAESAKIVKSADIADMAENSEIAECAENGEIEESVDIAESSEIVESADIAEIAEIVESVDIAEVAKSVTPTVNVKSLIKMFEVVENPGTDAIDNLLLRNNGLNSSQTSPLVDQPGIVGQLVKRFGDSEKIQFLDDKPTLQVINRTSAAVNNLIDRFNCATV